MTRKRLYDFIDAESRFSQIFSWLKEIRDKSTEDPEERIAQLKQDRDRKQQELEELIEAVYGIEDLSFPDRNYESLRGIKSRLIREAQNIVQSNNRLFEYSNC